ncbi:MAG: hypothetical protein IPF81_17680 [Bacteroidetes bacterium]|nr:hypothetical protein [Bacteroidota bacterium]
MLTCALFPTENNDEMEVQWNRPFKNKYQRCPDAETQSQPCSENLQNRSGPKPLYAGVSTTTTRPIKVPPTDSTISTQRRSIAFPSSPISPNPDEKQQMLYSFFSQAVEYFLPHTALKL